MKQQYTKYFRAEQKVQLRIVNQRLKSTEALNLNFVNHGEGCFELHFPHNDRSGKEFLLSPGMSMELLTESLGIGVSLPVEFLDYAEGNGRLIRLKGTGDLKVFQRRTQPRIDLHCGVRFTRGQGVTYQAFREEWLKSREIIEATELNSLPVFPQSAVNLSATGVRIAVKPPVEQSSLFLVLLQLTPETKPLSLLCETAWKGSNCDGNGKIPCGMQFIGISDADRDKITAHTKQFLAA